MLYLYSACLQHCIVTQTQFFLLRKSYESFSTEIIKTAKSALVVLGEKLSYKLVLTFWAIEQYFLIGLFLVKNNMLPNDAATGKRYFYLQSQSIFLAETLTSLSEQVA